MFFTGLDNSCWYPWRRLRRRFRPSWRRGIGPPVFSTSSTSPLWWRGGYYTGSRILGHRGSEIVEGNPKNFTKDHRKGDGNYRHLCGFLSMIHQQFHHFNSLWSWKKCHRTPFKGGVTDGRREDYRGGVTKSWPKKHESSPEMYIFPLDFVMGSRRSRWQPVYPSLTADARCRGGGVQAQPGQLHPQLRQEDWHILQKNFSLCIYHVCTLLFHTVPSHWRSPVNIIISFWFGVVSVYTVLIYSFSWNQIFRFF